MKKTVSVLASAFMMMSLFVAGCTGINAASDPAPVPASAPAPASVEAESYTAEDARNLQQYLLAQDAEQQTDRAYDLNGDGRRNAVDLTLMKRGIPVTGEQSDTIVVYFSRTGNTEKIAEYLIDLTGADSYVIEAAVPYTDDDIAYQDSGCRANQEQDDKTVRPEIAGTVPALGGYDTVFLGYPIWWGEEPRIIDTFLESCDLSEKTVIPFCTSGSSGIAASERNIAALVPIGRQLSGRRFAAGAAKDDVKAWYDTLPLTKEDAEVKLNLAINGHVLTVSLADSTAAKELAEKLKAGAVTLSLNEYGGFEKVGKLPWALTKSDESTVTEAGDIMLYQGNQMTVFYNSNSWSYTKLGHIDSVTQDELAAILGSGDVTAELSLAE